jgi:hypothetical protein
MELTTLYYNMSCAELYWANWAAQDTYANMYASLRLCPYSPP